jgi:CHC2 zinc finger
MSAEIIAQALGGRRAGGSWMACCPAHDDRKPSLSIRESNDGKVLVRCHAGCKQHQVIAALKACGIWSDPGRRHVGMTGYQFLKVGRKCIYRRDEFEAWLAKHQRSSTSEYPRERG